MPCLTPNNAFLLTTKGFNMIISFDDYNSVRGAYHAPCNKFAYRNETFAKAALRNCQNLGRKEKLHYLCDKCSMYHLSSMPSPPSTDEPLDIKPDVTVIDTIEVDARNSVVIKTERTKNYQRRVVLDVHWLSLLHGGGSHRSSNMTISKARELADAMSECISNLHPTITDVRVQFAAGNVLSLKKTGSGALMFNLAWKHPDGKTGARTFAIGREASRRSLNALLAAINATAT